MMRSMVTVLASVLAAALAVVITLRWGVVAPAKRRPRRHSGGHLHELLEIHLGRITGLEQRLTHLEADHVDVRAAVAHGIEDIDRVDKRIKATIRRSKDQLEEAGLQSPALDAEAEHFRVIDGGGGDDPGLPPVQEDVGDAASSIPGVPASALAKVRGYYGSA